MKERPLLSDLLVAHGFLPSKGEFRRLTQGRGISVLCGAVKNGKVYRKFIPITNLSYRPIPTDVIKVGKLLTVECRFDSRTEYLTELKDRAPSTLPTRQTDSFDIPYDDPNV